MKKILKPIVILIITISVASFLSIYAKFKIVKVIDARTKESVISLSLTALKYSQAFEISQKAPKEYKKDISDKIAKLDREKVRSKDLQYYDVIFNTKEYKTYNEFVRNSAVEADTLLEYLKTIPDVDVDKNKYIEKQAKEQKELEDTYNNSNNLKFLEYITSK